MSDACRFSIVVPCFRSVETIERTLESLVAQNYSALEIIVIDGGSQDGTVDIIKKFADHIAYWVSEPDGGQVDALNKGFTHATGTVYGWLCADDELAPGALARVAQEFAEHPEADVVTGGCRRDFNGAFEVVTEPGEDFLDNMFCKNTIEQPSTFWRRHVHETAGSIDGSMRFAFDWELWCRFKRNGAHWRAIPDVLSVYYFSTTNLTSTGGRKIVNEMYRIIKDYGPYDGRIADIYMMLYRIFDLRGFYDADAKEKIPKWKLSVFYFVLRILYRRYDVKVINAYNWNFASRQERGLSW